MTKNSRIYLEKELLKLNNNKNTTYQRQVINI